MLAGRLVGCPDRNNKEIGLESLKPLEKVKFSATARRPEAKGFPSFSLSSPPLGFVVHFRSSSIRRFYPSAVGQRLLYLVEEKRWWGSSRRRRALGQEILSVTEKFLFEWKLRVE